MCVVRVIGQRGPCIVPALSVGRERRPGPPLSKRPPCFMHSVLCDDKRQCGGWNAGLQGPREGWAYGRTGVQFSPILQTLEWFLSSLPHPTCGHMHIYGHETVVPPLPEHSS